MGHQLLMMIPLLGLSIAGALLLVRRKRKSIPKDWGAIVEKVELLPPPPPAFPAAPHPLTGLTFVIKDIFDVAGCTVGFGCPAWKQSHAPAATTAPCVQLLVAAGAKLVGKTHMDEMAYSIFGENLSLGTPLNPVCHQHVPGGSSSGAAVAVAADMVDFAIGTDTAGSVRIPAAWCGVLGYRPSHGGVGMEGCVTMAQSLDTVGVFASDPSILRHVSHLLLRQPFMPPRRPTTLYLADDLFDCGGVPRRHLTEALVAATEQMFGPIIKYVRLGSDLLLPKVPALAHFMPLVGKKGGQNGTADKHEATSRRQQEGDQALAALAEAMKLLQRFEFRTSHSSWLRHHQPKLQPDVSARVQLALESDEDELREHARHAQTVREELRGAITELLRDDALLALPSSSSFPPRLRSKASVLDAVRAETMKMVAIGSMGGCPQVTLPIGRFECSPTGLPLAVGLLARHGADRFLLDSLAHVAAGVQQAYESLGPKLGLTSRSPSAASGAAGAEENTQTPAEIAKEKGNKAYKQKHFDQAVDHYSTAIRHDSSNATYYSNRAMAYLQLHMFEQVEADCSAALNLDKKNVKAMLRRGTAREMLGFYQEAFADFQQALVLEPTNKTAMEAVTRMRENDIVR